MSMGWHLECQAFDNFQRKVNTHITLKQVLATLILLLSLDLFAGPKPKEKIVDVVIDTSKGKIELQLDSEKAPLSVKNFLNYVEKKFYDGLVFHRVINNFMIQGGGFDKDLKLKPTDAAIKNEATNGLKNLKGSIAMARTPDINSATSQFYINHKDNDFLDHKGTNPSEFGYAVFGKVTKGIEVVDAIAQVKTVATATMRDVPETPVVINSIRVKKKEEQK